MEVLKMKNRIKQKAQWVSSTAGRSEERTGEMEDKEQ